MGGVGGDRMGTSAQDPSIDGQIVVVASIAKEISGVDKQTSNFFITPFLF